MSNDQEVLAEWSNSELRYDTVTESYIWAIRGRGGAETLRPLTAERARGMVERLGRLTERGTEVFGAGCAGRKR